jgi:D-alanyl-D-alanine carboxypeptidase
VEDQFRIASISKTFIAAEVLKLAETGKIKLDDPLDVYLPETPNGGKVTIRHLLSHRSGYFDPIHDDPGFIPYIAGHLERQWTRDEMLAITFEHDLFFQPGTGYRYSNSNYMLLGLVIEKVTQRSLGQVLTSDLIVPLDLERTLYTTPATDTQQTDLVLGYITHPLTGETVVSTTIPYATVVSTSVDTMISNASDLLRWSRSLYGNESVVLESHSKEQMLTFDEIGPYGLGVFRSDTPIGVSFGHGGETAGYLSLMEYYPAQDLSMVILVNADAPSIDPGALRDELLAILFQVDLDAEVEALVADMKSEDPSTRNQAIIALGHSGSQSDDATQALIMVLKEDASAENRKEAALALGLVGRGSEEARQALTNALSDGDSSVRAAAKRALSVRK